jgi:hypothetical protein
VHLIVRLLTDFTDVSETEFRIAIKLDDGRHEDEEDLEEERTLTHVYYNIKAHRVQPQSSSTFNIHQITPMKRPDSI